MGLVNLGPIIFVHWVWSLLGLIYWVREFLGRNLLGLLNPNILSLSNYSKTCLKGPLSKRPKIGFQDQLLLNAVQKYCRMLQGEHSAILSTFIKLPFVIKIFVLSIFEWLLKTGFTVHKINRNYF